MGPSLWSTIWINLVTYNQLKSYPCGLGPIPWETPPQGEACPIAKQLQGSLMGRLVPYSRFFLLEEAGLRYSEGIAHPGYKDGSIDPSAAADFSGKEPKALWVDPEHRPWRLLTALLSFIHSAAKKQYECKGLLWAVPRVQKTKWNNVTLWSGGLRVSNNAGEQYVSGTDDFVESEMSLSSAFLNEAWFIQFELEMGELEKLSKIVYGSCLGYQKALKAEGDKIAGQATNLFWQLAERQFQPLVDACVEVTRAKALRKTFAAYAEQAYNTFCPQDTARQLEEWANHRPNLEKYLA
jgi:CRISPR system Cascade subunit CasA